MKATKMTKAISKSRLLLAAMVALPFTVYGAAPGITTTGTFSLTAQDAFLNMPDGQAVYSWGYGCATGFTPTFLPNRTGVTWSGGAPACPTMQVPGPTLIVTEGAAGTTVTIQLINNLPPAAGNTSILFPGLNVTTSCTGGVQGLLTCEAAHGGTVTYTINNPTPGTHPYYSGTQGDLQVEMGLYGALIVLPAGGGPTNCSSTITNLYGKPDYGSSHSIPGFPEHDFRLANAAYDHPATCYDREYLFQWAEMDSRIHRQALAQVTAHVGCNPATDLTCKLNVQTEPYHPAYFLINGRSMPDLMDPNFAAEYPHQPYNGNPHMHPGELTLVRTIGQGRWQHPFHEHANHVRILARDGNLVLSPTNVNYPGATAPGLAGVLMFNTDTTPGESFDGIFYFTGRGLNWDPFGHHPPPAAPNPANATNQHPFPNDPLASLPCTPDANGYNTVTPTSGPFAGVNPQTQLNYYEWCQDHNKPVQVAPFGDVAGGGPATLPDPNIFTNGAWYGGTPYFGPDANLRATMPACSTTLNAGCTTLLPSNVQANPASERGWAFMWHSHNEREITTNNVFPGGMLMMMLVDSREFAIDESQ